MVVGAIVAVAVLAVAAVAGVALGRRNGHMRAQASGPQAHLTPSQLGQPLGERATLLQFSTAVCAPCRATRTLLADMAAGSPGVAHVELDVADHLDLVRTLDVRRAPTVFVLGRAGQVCHRASGVPRRADLEAALSEVTGGSQPA
ncbi:MAG TPA: thioredoxin family protein [Streptosporangiaceae bacterium]|nr:thioredoxin family protein [Streptosporangiaceae bacterium]